MRSPKPVPPSASAAHAVHERHLHRLAEMLLAYPAVPLSGARLARELGISRSTVWEGMEALRGYGVALRGRPGTGYQLLAIPDLPLPALLGPGLRTQRLGTTIHHFFRVGSTQQAALEAARAGADEGALFVAETQTAGRGRHGHGWESPPCSGIYASLVLRPAGAPGRLLALTLAAGLAVADAVEEAADVRVEIRWPNDLLLGGRKFCGVLLEMSAEATRIQHAVLGFGMNVRGVPPAVSGLATSIAAHASRRPSRVAVLAAALRHLERRYTALEQGGDAAAVLAEFERRSRYARGLHVHVGEGEDSFEGVTEGLDAEGFLRVRLADGSVRTAWQGNVREERPAPPGV